MRAVRQHTGQSASRTSTRPVLCHHVRLQAPSAVQLLTARRECVHVDLSASAGAVQGRTRRHVQCRASKGFGSGPNDKMKIGQTCPCGSKQFYRECCEPYHTGKATPETAEAQLRARFCAFVKGNERYIISTYHPTCIPLMFPDLPSQDPLELADALKRYVRAGCRESSYSTLRIHAVESGEGPDEAYVEFSYKSVPKVADKRTGSRHTRVKAAPVERNTDGTVKVLETRERSRFLRDSAGWRFADFKIIMPEDTSTQSQEASKQSTGPVEAVAQ